MIKIDVNKCIGCGKCVRYCVDGNLEIEEKKARAMSECITCGHCLALCPESAITLEDDTYDIEDVEMIPEDYKPVSADEFLKMVKYRRSIRSYQNRKIEEEKLKMILEAARYTASGSNSQRFIYVVVQERMEEFKELLWKYLLDDIANLPEESAYRQYGIIKRAQLPKEDPRQDTMFWHAPCMILLTAVEGGMTDCGLAGQNMEMMAVAQELGVLYNGFLQGTIERHEELKKWLGIEGRSIRLCMVAGYPELTFRTSVPRKKPSVIWR